MFKITNQHNTIVWEGEAHSFKDAWFKMFDACSYPKNDKERSICEQIELGMWIERVEMSEIIDRGPVNFDKFEG